MIAGTSVLIAQPPAPGSYTAKVKIAYQCNNSPFSASVGICQETMNETPEQVKNIAAAFKMVHIYQFDEKLMQTALSSNMEVMLGTTSAQATSFAASVDNAKTFVTNNVVPYKGVIKTILIGNEPNIVNTCIDPKTFLLAAQNLKSALKINSINIPVSATLVFGCTTAYYPPNKVLFAAYSTTPVNNVYSPIPYIQAIKSINANPFIFYDFYPNLTLSSDTDPLLGYCLFEVGGGPDSSCCGMFDAQYLSACNATYAVEPTVEVYVGEVGWPKASGAGPAGTSANQATFVNNFYKYWVDMQKKKTIPVFLFYAYPNRSDNAMFALFSNSGINFSNYAPENGKTSNKQKDQGDIDL